MHAGEGVVLTVPLRLGAFAVGRGDNLHGFGVDDGQVVGADAEEFGLVLSVEAGELVVAVKAGKAEDGVEFGEAGEVGAGEGVEGVEEEAVR